MSEEMRILTVRQPWAWAIFHGKDVENRVRNIAGAYRGPVAIHAAARQLSVQEHTDAATRIMQITGFFPLFTLPYGTGAIIGVVDLVGVHGVIESGGRLHCETVVAPTDEGVSGACSRWGEKDMHHLVLANPRPLSEPIPYRGALGLRRLPDHVAGAVRKAVA